MPATLVHTAEINMYAEQRKIPKFQAFQVKCLKNQTVTNLDIDSPLLLVYCVYINSDVINNAAMFLDGWWCPW